eukprot:12748638-Alexandrium_andersonii.AAC.1
MFRGSPQHSPARRGAAPSAVAPFSVRGFAKLGRTWRCKPVSVGGRLAAQCSKHGSARHTCQAQT